MKRNQKTSLEIAPNYIAATVLHHQSSRIKLLKAAYQERPQPADRISAEELKAFFSANQLRAKEVTVALDDPSLYIRQLTVPRNLLRESEQNIKWYFEHFLPYSISKAALSHHICDVGWGSRALVIMATVFRETLDAILEELENAGVRVKKIDIVPFALHRLFCANYELPKERCAGIFDLGSGYGFGAILKGGNIVMARKFMIRQQQYQENIIKAIDETLRYFEDQFARDVVESLYFTGRSGIDSDTKHRLEERLKIEVAAIEVDRKIETEDVDRKLLQKVEVALGTALDQPHTNGAEQA